MYVCIVRKWKRYREFGEAKWEWEIGEPQQAFNPEADLLAPSGDNVRSPLSLRYYSCKFIAHIHKEGYGRALRVAYTQPEVAQGGVLAGSGPPETGDCSAHVQ